LNIEVVHRAPPFYVQYRKVSDLAKDLYTVFQSPSSF